MTMKRGKLIRSQISQGHVLCTGEMPECIYRPFAASRYRSLSLSMSLSLRPVLSELF